MDFELQTTDFQQITITSQTSFELQTVGLTTIYITFSNVFLRCDYFVYEMVQRDLSMGLDKSSIKCL